MSCCAGCGLPDASRRTCGTTRAGRCCARGMSGWRGRPARSWCSRSRSVAHLPARVVGRGGRRRGAHGRGGGGQRGNRDTARGLRHRCARGPSGQRGRTAELAEDTLDDVESRGEGMGVGISHFTSAMLYNGLGRYSEALNGAEHACEHEDLGVISWALTELIEAAARSGRRGVATVRSSASVTAQAGGTDWPRGGGALTGAGERRWRRRRPLPRSDRPPWPHPCARRARPFAPRLWRMAAPGAPPGGGTGAAPHRLRDAE